MDKKPIKSTIKPSIKKTDSKTKSVKVGPVRVDVRSGGNLHKTPRDLQKLLNANSNKNILTVWNTLTPLTKNEWICWVTIVKKEETRAKHLAQLCDDLRKGRRRPCCWPGCPHRRPSAQKWFGKKK